MTTFNPVEFSPPTNFEDGFEGVSESDQITMTLEAVRTVGIGTTFLQRVFSGKASEVKPRALLALLAYSYARGIYSAEDIERSVSENITAQYLSGGIQPGACELAGFRRHAAPQVHMALEIILSKTGMARNEDAAEEAGRRLARAIFLDAMNRDW